VYLIGIGAFAANADDVRLNIIGVVTEPLSTCGRPMLVTTAVVSVLDEDFPQATAKERSAIVSRLRGGIPRILSNGLRIEISHSAEGQTVVERRYTRTGLAT
jgi:hypothetical protein